MYRNIPELLVFFCLIFSDIKMLFFGLLFKLYILQLSPGHGFWKNFRNTDISTNKWAILYQKIFTKICKSKIGY